MTETTLDNNDDADEVEIEVVTIRETTCTGGGTLPRTGAAIGSLLVLALGLIVGGRLLMGRRRRES